MIIEVEETYLKHQDPEIELIAERDHIEIIGLEIMIASLVKPIPENGKFLYFNYNLKTYLFILFLII